MRLRAPRNKTEWIMLGAGALALLLAGCSLYRGHASTNWPRREAVITASHLHYGQKGATFEVHYAFDCDGQRCTGDRWHYRIFSGSADDIWVSGRGRRILAAAASYPVGQRVQVAVKPDDPTESVLEPGVSSDDATIAVGGLALLLLAVLGLRREEAPTARETPGAALADSTTIPPPRRRVSLLTLLAVLIFVYSGYTLYRDFERTRWPEVAGTVVYRDLASESGWIGSHRAVVRYQYEVRGTRYLRDAVVTSAGDAAKDWIAPLVKGGPVKVRVNPADPGDAAIEPGPGWSDFALPVFGVVLLALAWAMRKAREAITARVSGLGRVVPPTAGRQP